LPITTRVLLAKQFGIAKVGSTHVVNNVVEQDGYKFQEVESTITKEALQQFVDSDETDYPALFKMAVDKVNGIVPAKEIEFTELEGSGTIHADGSITSTEPKVKRVYKKRTK